MSTMQEIEAAVLRLPESERLLLADRILSTLPAPPGALAEEAIAEEAARRDAEIESGKVRPLTDTEFWEDVRRMRE